VVAATLTAMTTTTAHPVPIMLPGQAASPAGPTDLVAMYVMHHGFRRDLRAFAGAVAGTPVADRPAWRALQERWALFSFILHEHHSGEDAGLWPLLLERVDAAGDAAGRATLAAMATEHADIDPLLAACSTGFERLAERADDDARAALEVRLVAVRQLLEKHLGHEERDAMALFQAYATPADWQRLEEEHFKPAYGLRDTLRVVPWALHELPAEARDRLLASDPANRVFLAVWRSLLRGPFERRERRAFRHQ
jgi:hypothetical protein